MGIADVLTLKRPESLIFLANLGLGSGVEYAPFSHEGEGGNGHRASVVSIGTSDHNSAVNMALAAEERVGDMSTAERIFKEAQKLPDTLAQEVLDFIEYIEIKHGLRDRLTEELKQAQEPVMRHVWDNQDDEVWNAV